MDYITERDRIYAKSPEGEVIAEVTFPAVDGVNVINHTFVHESLRGKGIAGELVKLAADSILSDGRKIGVTCPYAVEWFKRHPEYVVIHPGSATCRIEGRR